MDLGGVKILLNEKLESLYSNWKKPNVHFVNGGVIEEVSRC
jgi:hypothetical protein